MAEVWCTAQALEILDNTDLVPQADAIVSTSFFRADLVGLDPLPLVDRVTSNPERSAADSGATTDLAKL